MECLYAHHARIESIFDDPTTRANIHFTDEGLDKLYGGDIVAVASEPNYMHFSIGKNMCARLKLN
jgi:hypothetical protein